MRDSWGHIFADVWKVIYYSSGFNLYPDIDECANGQDDCAENATCSNMPGMFRCDCAKGHFGNGSVCLSKDLSHL